MAEEYQRKDPFVYLPTRIMLTGDGLRLFSKNPGQLKRFKNRDGVLKEGVESSRYNAVLVQKMVLNAFVEDIYVSLPNLLGYRQEIISTNNLIVYGILYKKLSPTLAEMLFQSSVVKTYNRKNPKNAIVDLGFTSRERVEQARATHGPLYEALELEIKEEVKRRVLENRLISQEDKSVRLRSLDKFIAWIDRRIWYLYNIVYQTPMRQEIRHAFASMIAVYLDHTQIATHLSNLLMEFVQNAEKAHFERVIVRNRLATRDMVDRYLRDPDNRNHAIQTAERQGQNLELDWSMNPETASVGQQYRIGISISNYGIIDEELQKKLAQKIRANTEGISLARFYEDGGDERLGAGLGLLYNSYLEDICRKEKIFYRCNIFPEPKMEKTTVRLEMVV